MLRLLTVNRLLTFCLPAVVMLCFDIPGTASAQMFQEGQGGDNETQAAPAASPPAAADEGQKFPEVPRQVGFFRGNAPGNAGNGFYISLFRIGLVIILFLIWVASSWWAHDDSSRLHVRHEFWNSVIFMTGVVGFLLVLTLPSYLLGFFVMALTYGVPIGFYVHERNQKVPESGKVMTPAHLRKVAIRTLAKVGIHIGEQDEMVAIGGPSLKFIGKSTGLEDNEARSKAVENSQGYLAAKELVYDAILRRGTDIHIEPKEKQVAVRIRIDGVMYPTEPFDTRTGEAIINIFKVLGAMDITEKRRPQDGSFRAILEGREIDFRAASQGTRHGEKMSLRILDQSNSVSNIAQLGFRKQLSQQLQGIIHQPHGMFICCGPTGAGKSTTLYAALNDIDAYQRNIITVEDPIEYKMDNINQIEINRKSDMTFANSLRSILRQDPDVVMIGEIRDSETANIACQAANTGHMVFSTIHANDTITALYRFLELDLEPFMVSNSISAILAQRLARRLCPDCKVAYRPSPEMLKREGLPPEKVSKLYRPPEDRDTPCGGCGGLGFRGRIGVFELLLVNDRVRDMIRDKAAMTEIKSEARKNGMLYMREEGMRLVVKGVTSYDELMRVVK